MLLLSCIQETSKIKEIIKIIKVVISYIRKHWGTSRGTKVTKFKPAWSCQSLLASNLHIHKEKARKISQWKCSKEYTVCWFGSSVVWDKLMGWEKKGEEVAGNMVAKQRKDNRERRREHMQRSTGTNNSSLPPDLQVRAVYHFRENIASLNQHTHTHKLPPLCVSTLRTAVRYLWTPLGGVHVCLCVCTVTARHAAPLRLSMHAWTFVSQHVCMWVSCEVSMTKGLIIFICNIYTQLQNIYRFSFLFSFFEKLKRDRKQGFLKCSHSKIWDQAGF